MVTYIKTFFSVVGNVLWALGRAWATVWIVVQVVSGFIDSRLYRITAVLLSVGDRVTQ